MVSAGTTRARRECRAGRHRSAWASNAALRVPHPIHPQRAISGRRESWHATNAELSPKAPRAPARGARAVSPRPERQADAVAFLVERHVVHEVTNDEQPAAVLALEVVGVRRIGNAAAIEALTIIIDMNTDVAASHLDINPYHPVGIFAVPVTNGVPECFGERGAEIEADAAGRQRTGGKMSGDQFDGVAHHPEIARDVEAHRARRHIKS